MKSDSTVHALESRLVTAIRGPDNETEPNLLSLAPKTKKFIVARQSVSLCSPIFIALNNKHHKMGVL
jgi:hypothetical protein